MYLVTMMGKAITARRFNFRCPSHGNLLRLVGNNGVVYEGNIGDMNTTAAI